MYRLCPPPPDRGEVGWWRGSRRQKVTRAAVMALNALRHFCCGGVLFVEEIRRRFRLRAGLAQGQAAMVNNESGCCEDHFLAQAAGATLAPYVRSCASSHAGTAWDKSVRR